MEKDGLNPLKTVQLRIWVNETRSKPVNRFESTLVINIQLSIYVFLSYLRILCLIYFKVSYLQYFQSLYQRFKRVLLSSNVQKRCSTSLVWWQYRCYCVKSSKRFKYFKNKFYFMKKLKTAKVRTMSIGRSWISNFKGGRYQ